MLLAPVLPTAETTQILAPAWLAVGGLGNACYFSRSLVQWVASERAGRTAAPRLFWWLSAAGSVLVGAYTWRIGQPVLLLSYLLVLAIYVRNLCLRGRGRRPPPALAFLALGLCAWLGLSASALNTAEDSRAWTILAGVGAAIWSSRFVVQWVSSERRGESHFPLLFWWLSLVGNSLMLAYAIHLRDAVLVAGLAVGPFAQVRNLMLAWRAQGPGLAVSSAR